MELARRSRGTPRIANRLLRRVRDFAEVKGTGSITQDIAAQALAMLDVDPQGFDVMDRKLLEALIHRFDGGPVGLDVKSHVIISPPAAGPSFAPEKFCTELSSPSNGSKPHEPHPSSSPHHAQNTR